MLQTGQTLAKQLLHRISGFFRDRRSRLCFVTAAVCAVAAYLYYITNLISNNDMIACTPYGPGESIRSGRWALYLLTELLDRLWGGHYNVPAFNVLVALVEMAIGAALLVRVLELKRPLSCVCLTAITLTIPAFGSAVFFSYSIQYYALAILLVIGSVWLLKQKGKAAFFAGVAAGAFSIGIYQAYLPFFAVLMLLVLIQSSLQQEQKPKALFWEAVKYGAALILSYLCYYLILHALLAVLHLELSTYQGIDTMGQIRLSGLWTAIKDYVLLPFTKPYFGFNATPLIGIGLLCCFLISLLCLLFTKGLSRGNVLWLLCFLLALPLAANATHYLAGGSVLYTRMTLGLIAIYYLPILLAEYVPFRKPGVKPLLSAALAVILLLCSANYAWQSNGNYMSVAYSNRKAENYFNSMFTRIRSTEGYRQDLPIVYIGRQIGEQGIYDNWIVEPFAYTARIGAWGQLNQYSREAIILNYLGYQWRQITPEEEAENAELIQQMSCYPNDDSIRITEKMILVRLE